MAKTAVYTVMGGLGRQLMQAQIALELTEKYDKVLVFAHYINELSIFFSGHPKVTLLTYDQLGAMSATIMTNPDDYDIYRYNIYDDGEFSKKRASFYNVARKLVGLKEKKEDNNEDGQTTMPVFVMNTMDNIRNAEEFSKVHPHFVMFCRQGGLSNLPGPDGRRQPGQEHGLLRSYPIDKSEKLVELLNQKGYEVLQVCLPEEPHIKGAIYMNNEMPMTFYTELAKYAEAVITIDSSLMHFTIANCKKMVAIWLQTNVNGFGYIKAINLKPVDYTPISLLLSGIQDSPVCEPVSPEEVVDAVEGRAEKTV